ncbi:CPBP family intramembrane glutamic endopeptidase [Levilactobacillus enshiensis]|uniref:CPBP family intramembrane glutamic endopeptidase n=1 Tax=Levilactobacillus enshiensis TaxID=2590213 RepID=UPI00117B07F7|nr:CPBP family intramembrane glutamic endopeptidase [Levilactobacillus enshiensis]
MSNSISTRRLTWQFIGFWFVWLLVQATLNIPISHHFHGWSQEILLDAIKLTIWVGAGWWFIHQAPHGTLSLTNREQWRPNWHFTAGYLVWLVIILYLGLQFWLLHHGLRVNRTFIPQYWGRYFLVVGIAEEFVTRGYFLNALLKKTSFTTANVIQALGFASMHIPRYLTTVPTMSVGAWLSNLASVFVLGLLFGWLYKTSRSLWPGIIVHMTWDILVTLFG